MRGAVQREVGEGASSGGGLCRVVVFRAMVVMTLLGDDWVVRESGQA